MKNSLIGKTALVVVVTLALFASIIVAGCGPQPKPVPTESTEKVSLEAADAPASKSASSSAASTASVANKTPSASAASSSASAVVPTAQQAAEEAAKQAEASSAAVNSATQQVAAIADNSGMLVGVAIIDLTTGVRNGYNADKSVVSASMIKLAIAYAFMEQVAAGNYSLDDSYTLDADDVVGGTGSLAGLGVGATVSYGELVNKMISVSDNTATNALIDTIGMEAVNATAQRLGFEGTRLQRRMMDSVAMANGTENYVSANDVADLLEMVYTGTFVNSDCSAFILEALEEQQDSVGILGGLPAGTVFAHKTGTLGTVHHDGGIVEGEHPYVLVTLCSEPGFYEAGALSTMAEIGAAVNETLSTAPTAAPSTEGVESAGSREGDPNEEDAPSAPEAPTSKTVVCLGDSITSGGAYSYEPEAWPTYLQQQLYGLSDQWTVENLGVSGTTLLDMNGRRSYRSTGNVDEAKELAPDVAIIMLGTNDSSNPNLDTDAFRSQLEKLVTELRSAQPSLSVVLMAPPHVHCGPGSNFTMNDSVIGNEIRPIVQEVASATGSQFIDLYEFSDGHDEWFPDTVHPNGVGNRAIANYIFEEVFQ